MRASNQTNKSDSSVDLVTSILLKYPVINTVNINLEERELEISFLVEEVGTDISWEEEKAYLIRNFNLFNKFQNKAGAGIKLQINRENYCGLSKVNLVRNLNELSQQEMDFMIKLIKETFAERLLKNQLHEQSFSFDLVKSIDGILAQIEELEYREKYLGFREKDKILVFNKNK
ncbi:hypothetical protein MWH28_10340 [Natroniella sulfidigena]|uniref:hypothetical protein n=1 Tax=Natroniella sulfidigena TaxID=723921 RepID=UPI00200AC6AA|nr:hypothetical protein [Natroniella sulfidigena]MCK8817759.1 hypothetical protein [Natroniella sulfidigena]